MDERLVRVGIAGRVTSGRDEGCFQGLRDDRNAGSPSCSRSKSSTRSPRRGCATAVSTRARSSSAQADESERFRFALGCVWIWRLPDQTFRRVERAARVELADPHAEERAHRLGER